MLNELRDKVKEAPSSKYSIIYETNTHELYRMTTK